MLADEINRTPPKTQAALLEAMQEHRVTIQGRTYTLEEPFFVLATQNPIEQEGTYPLPEAQLDRFMFKIVIDHLPEDDELAVVRSTTAILEPEFSHAITGADILAFQRLVRKVPVADPVLRYALALVRATRPNAPGAPEFIRKWVQFGASVRAAQYLVLGAKARALMQRPLPRELRRHPRARAPRAAAPDPAQLPRGVGARDDGLAGGPVAGGGAAAALGDVGAAGHRRGFAAAGRRPFGPGLRGLRPLGSGERFAPPRLRGACGAAGGARLPARPSSARSALQPPAPAEPARSLAPAKRERSPGRAQRGRSLAAAEPPRSLARAKSARAVPGAGRPRTKTDHGAR